MVESEQTTKCHEKDQKDNLLLLTNIGQLKKICLVKN